MSGESPAPIRHPNPLIVLILVAVLFVAQVVKRRYFQFKARRRGEPLLVCQNCTHKQYGTAADYCDGCGYSATKVWIDV